MSKIGLELIDRNRLIRDLLNLKVDVSGLRPRTGEYVRQEIERFIQEDIIDLVKEQPYASV